MGLAAYSQISCGCFLTEYGEDRLCMQELGIKALLHNSNSTGVWHLSSASSKEYGLWKWAKITQGAWLFFFFFLVKCQELASWWCIIYILQICNCHLLSCYSSTLNTKYSVTVGFAHWQHLHQARTQLREGKTLPEMLIFKISGFVFKKSSTEVNSVSLRFSFYLALLA